MSPDCAANGARLVELLQECARRDWTVTFRGAQFQHEPPRSWEILITMGRPGQDPLYSGFIGAFREDIVAFTVRQLQATLDLYPAAEYHGPMARLTATERGFSMEGE
jgi:hypothetical protein